LLFLRGTLTTFSASWGLTRIGKAFLATAILGGFLLFAGAPSAKANYWDDCNRRVAYTDWRLHEAIVHFGYYSPEANYRRYQRHEAYEALERYRRYEWRERAWRERENGESTSGANTVATNAIDTTTTTTTIATEE
jgi:hypothetical protein